MINGDRLLFIGVIKKVACPLFCQKEGRPRRIMTAGSKSSLQKNKFHTLSKKRQGETHLAVIAIAVFAYVLSEEGV
jgi:hypothetical protein